jgi:hypothetical protein
MFRNLDLGVWVQVCFRKWKRFSKWKKKNNYRGLKEYFFTRWLVVWKG